LKIHVPSTFNLWLKDDMKITRFLLSWSLSFACFLSNAVSAQLATGVRGVATHAGIDTAGRGCRTPRWNCAKSWTRLWIQSPSDGAEALLFWEVVQRMLSFIEELVL